MTALTAEELNAGIGALREAEVAWLSGELSRAIANLGYPVGCGIAPHPEQIAHAAEIIFDRYAAMIRMAAGNRS